MKKLIYLFCLMVFLSSCKKPNNPDLPDVSDIPDPNKIGYDIKILANYHITTIAFDVNGIAWIGTNQGLVKYSATETLVFNSTNSNLPASTPIYDIEIDSKGNIWIGSSGLIKFDGNTFTVYNSQNSSIPEDLVLSIAIDSKDNIWFTSSRFRRGGIGKFDGTNWSIFTPNNSQLPVNFARKIVIDKNDNVWVGLTEIVNTPYLVKISNNNWTIFSKNEIGFTPYYIGNIELNSKNELYVAIDYSLSSMAINNGHQVFIFNNETTGKLQFDNETNIFSTTIDNQDYIWFIGSKPSGLSGIYGYYNGFTWKFDQTSLSTEFLTCIKQAKDNKMWIGTFKGLYIKYL